MLSLEDERAISRYEDRYYDPDCYTRERDDEAEWDKADDEYQERYVERRLNG